MPHLAIANNLLTRLAGNWQKRERSRNDAHSSQAFGRLFDQPDHTLRHLSPIHGRRPGSSPRLANAKNITGQLTKAQIDSTAQRTLRRPRNATFDLGGTSATGTVDCSISAGTQLAAANGADDYGME